jgi:hypothetical protein
VCIACVAAVIVYSASGSQSRISASEPAPQYPFFGYMPKIFAGASAVSSTKRSSEMRPRVHAVVIGKLHAVLDARAAVGDLGEVAQAQRLLVGKRNGQWSVETTCSTSSFSACHSGAWFFFSRSGGVKTYFASSKPGLPMSSSIDSTRYCVQVSPITGSPRSRACFNLAHRVLAGDMHDVDLRAAGQLAQRDHAMHGLGLGLGGRVSA